MIKLTQERIDFQLVQHAPLLQKDSLAQLRVSDEYWVKRLDHSEN